MRIDSHQHYWKVSRGDYHWMTPEVSALCRDYLPADLRPILLQHKIDKTILVQAAQTVAETEFLLDLAEHEPSIAGVVGWLDMDAPAFPVQFEQFRKSPNLSDSGRCFRIFRTIAGFCARRSFTLSTVWPILIFHLSF